MKTEISKKNGSNLLVMIFAITMLFVTILGTSLAWFTDKKDLEGNGTTPYVNVTVNNGSTSSGKDTVSTTATISKTIGEANSIDCPVTATINSNIKVLVRMSITIHWQDTSIDGSYGGTEIVVPNFGTNWLSTSTGSNYDKMNAIYLFYDTEIEKDATNKEIPLFDKLEIKSENRFGNINGQVVNVSVYVEAIQSNSVGMEKWGLSKDANGKLTIKS